MQDHAKYGYSPHNIAGFYYNVRLSFKQGIRSGKGIFDLAKVYSQPVGYGGYRGKAGFAGRRILMPECMKDTGLPRRSFKKYLGRQKLFCFVSPQDGNLYIAYRKLPMFI